METLKRISFVALAALAFSAFANAQTQTVIFEETFAGCDGTGGNPTEEYPEGQWSGSIANSNFSDSNADNEGWVLVSGKKANGCIKVGTTSAYGSATTPSVSVLSAADATLSFRAGSWYTAKGNPVSVEIFIADSETPIETIALEYSKFNEYKVSLPDYNGETITFHATTQKPFFLDDVKITVESTTTTDPSEDDDEEGEGENDDPSGETIPTSVKSPSHLSSDAPVYNLQGQRVDSSAKGILIQNGKKMIRK